MGTRPELDLGDNKSLSHSRRATFRRCRRLYYWQYVQKLEQKVTPAPLRMGAVYSDCLEQAEPNVANLLYSDYIADALHDSQYHLAEQLMDELAVVRPMAETYIKHIMLPDVKREVPFVGRASMGYQDNGFIDGVGEPLGNDRILLVENKLKGRFGKAEEASLATDEQLLGYIYNICKVYDTDPDKVDVRYEVAKKPALRQGKTETREAFRTRVSNDILSNPTKYHVVLGGEELRRNQHQLDQWEREFDRMAHDIDREFSMKDYYGYEAWPMNRDACHQYGACPLLRVCGASSEEEMAEAINRDFNIRGEA